MTRNEFLEKLRQALENDLHGQIVQENINYYNNYITEEVKKGRTEEAVTGELGDPWMIARTLIEAAENGSSDSGSYSAYDSGQTRESGNRNPNNSTAQVSGFGSWWKKVLLVLGIIGVFVLVIGVIGGLFALVAPLIVPLLVVLFILRLFGQGRR